jgi:hypothetical protein
MSFLFKRVQNECERIFVGFFWAFLLCLFIPGILSGQSTDQFAPTPVLTNEITGQIKARDIGDSRLTSYYYFFNGQRGDVFVNVVTNNLNGDIDIFNAKTLKPRTKITVYADSSNNETGRVVYMRQAERLILRVQGRSPNDDPATFQIKFAGSFEPITGVEAAKTTEIPKVENENTGTVRVNSVGTIIEDPVETNRAKETEIAAADPLDEEKVENKVRAGNNNPVNEEKTKKELPVLTKKEKSLPEDLSILKPRVIITDNLKPQKTETENVAEGERSLTVNLERKPKTTSAIVTIERVNEEEEKKSKELEEARKLAKISLKVRLKNGDKFERPMNEVTSVNVIKTVLTIVTSDGKIHEFSIFDVAKMTMD